MKTRTIKEVSNGLGEIEPRILIEKWERTGLMQGFSNELKHKMAIALEFLSTYIINERDGSNDKFISSSINTLFPVLHLFYKVNECVEPKFMYDQYKVFAQKMNIDKMNFDNNDEVLTLMHEFMDELRCNEDFYTHTNIHVEA